MPLWRDRCPLNEGFSPPPGARFTGAKATDLWERALRAAAVIDVIGQAQRFPDRGAEGEERFARTVSTDRRHHFRVRDRRARDTGAQSVSDGGPRESSGKSMPPSGGFQRMQSGGTQNVSGRCAWARVKLAWMLRNPFDGAAPESNRPSVGLPHRTGFEDLLGHRAHAAPRTRLPVALLAGSRRRAPRAAERGAGGSGNI